MLRNTGLANTGVLAINDDLPIRTDKPVHSGKVRSVYWLNKTDSQRLIREHNYDVNEHSDLAVMVISDRISAFDCIWHGENNLHGIPGKGAALNAISNHWFKLFKEQGLASSHILEIPHPLVWIVQKAQPVMIEAIARQYITGSMWRAYDKGERHFCGQQLAENLQKDQRLDEILITPSTKGILRGLSGVPEVDDANISRDLIERHWQDFGFKQRSDIDHYETLLKEGFHVISETLAKQDQMFVDTKFEFGYAKDKQGVEKLIYMDEVGTPDSSRIWDGEFFRQGKVVEKSKEAFRQALLTYFPDPDILLNKDRMTERLTLAKENALPLELMQEVSSTYISLAEKITDKPIALYQDPRSDIIETLQDKYALIM